MTQSLTLAIGETQILDVLGILRCLRGNHPRLGMPEAGYRQVIEAHQP